MVRFSGRGLGSLSWASDLSSYSSERVTISAHLGPSLALTARTGLRVSLIALTLSLHQAGESPFPYSAGAATMEPDVKWSV